MNIKKLTMKGMLALSMASALTLAGCDRLSSDGGEAASENGSGDSDVPELLFYQVGEAPDNHDELMQFANDILEEEAGATINMEYIGWGEFEQKMNVITSSGEDYDIALATNYVNNAQRGAYADLTDLIVEEGSDMLEYIDQSYIDGNKVNGNLYAVPVQGNTYAQNMFTFNPTYLDKYDLDVTDVENIDDLEPLLEVVHQNEPEVDVMSVGQGWRIGPTDKNLDYVLDENVPLAVYMGGDETKLINPYELDKEELSVLYTMHRYYEKGYVPQDAATSQKQNPTEGDTWFVRQETQGPQDYGDYLLQRVTGKDVVSVPITQPMKSAAQARMANFVISNNSDHKEEAMRVLNEINSNPELLNGLVLGPEGVNWEMTEENRVKILDPYYETKTYMSAWNLGNNDILYVDENVTDEQIAYKEKSMEEAKPSPILGFVLDTENIKNEITNVTNVSAQYLPGIHTGTLDPAKAIPEYNDKLKEAGIDKIVEEAQKQYDEFLKNKE
ncbi:MAG: ABC transporter substrate-binding protein [Alkalibacterium sp.]|nr:ABC transporter substrate-binding protein [Tetragenococcus koreensis]MDN6729748.1 ABC transporter substrate-binding protein [Alkalibacterium sp.]